jgi:signal peptidase
MLFAIAILALGAGIMLLHLQLSPVLSGSMRPGIQPGDLVVTEPIRIADLEVGDVISFFPPESTDGVLHRLVSITERFDGTWITTKGDANAEADPWGEIRLRGELAWRVAATVPAVGFVPIWTQGLRGPLLVLTGVVLAFTSLFAVRRPTWHMHPSPATGG